MLLLLNKCKFIDNSDKYLKLNWIYQIYSNLSFTFNMFYLSFIRIYFYCRVWLDILWEFCFKRNYILFSIIFIAPRLSFAVVISPIELFRDPNRMKVAPYLFYKSKDTPPILHSWKKELTCLSDSPKWSRKGI